MRLYHRRREFLAGCVGTATIALAGCGGESGPSTTDEVDIVVGPGNQFRFDPEELTIAAGDTVTWRFASSNHNVSAIPEAHPEVSIPEGAEPFASYEGSNHYAVNDPGTTYSHTLTTPGEYVYICVPHVSAGMVGRLIVTE